MEIKELTVGNMSRKLCEFSAMGIRELTAGSISRELCEFPARGNVHKNKSYLWGTFLHITSNVVKFWEIR